MLRAAAVAAFVAVALLYLDRLDYAPPYVEIDEVLIGLDAHAIATTGRDLRGEPLPLYSQTAEHSWYQPLVIYLTALTLKIVPLSEWSVRLPTVLIGILDVALMFVLARQLFGSGRLGAVAALLLALSPAHFIHSRYGMDYLYPVPFVLAWLLCLVFYEQRRRTWLLAAAAVALGAGFYSYIASIVLMPVYAALTVLLLLQERAPRRSFAIVIGGFAACLIPFLLWIARHPAAYRLTVEKYGLYDPAKMDAVQGLRSFVSYESVSARLSDYWSFFNPSFLFFGSGTKLMFSTGRAGVFLLPVAVFLVIGIADAWRHRRAPLNLILLIGFATAPLAALIVAEEHAIFRALVVLPFGVLLATLGVQRVWTAVTRRPLRRLYQPAALIIGAAGAVYGLWTLTTSGRLSASTLPLVALAAGLWVIGAVIDRTAEWRIVAWCLLALVPLQFALFRRDYFSDYRARSGYWLGGNIRGALEEVIARDARQTVPRVYFTTLQSSAGQIDGRDQYMDAYWKFYVTKHRRTDLLARTARFDADAVPAMQPNSLVVANIGDTRLDRLVAGGQLRRVKAVDELNGPPFFEVLER
jgi:4-amino-4-deoxy-L-arabinose transferase-like glycosyltransferase